jgi:hypothetical protein
MGQDKDDTLECKDHKIDWLENKILRQGSVIANLKKENFKLKNPFKVMESDSVTNLADAHNKLVDEVREIKESLMVTTHKKETHND